MQWPAVILAILLALPLIKTVLDRTIRRRALRNIRGPHNPSLLTGNTQDVFDHTALPLLRRNYGLYGRVMKIGWIFGDVALFIADPLALNYILIKEKESYQEIDHSGSLDMHFYLFGPGLLSTIGNEHKKQRKMLNPVFSISHMRDCFPMMQSATLQLRDILLSEVTGNGQEIDMADKMGRLALELISRAGFGHTFKALEGSSDATYVQALKEVVPALLKMGGLIPVASAVGISQLPGWLSRFLGRLLPYKDLHALMDLADTLHSTAQDIFEEKKAKFESGDDTKERKDLISILLRNNSTASAAERLTNEEVCAQIGTLIFAGTDTTSSAMARILYLLATHPEAQDRLRDELEGANWRDLDYDSLMALPYLDAICRETLRLYTPVPNRARRAATDTVLPLQRAVIGADGRQIREVFIPKGTVILANLDGLNTDPTIWGEDSYDWKPERWLKVPLPASVLEARIPGVYSNSATFLAGQRACIGFKFAELEMKTILSVLIPTFVVAPPKTEEVVFRWGLIITPSVKGKEMMTDPRLPLMLSKV